MPKKVNLTQATPEQLAQAQAMLADPWLQKYAPDATLQSALESVMAMDQLEAADDRLFEAARKSGNLEAYYDEFDQELAAPNETSAEVALPFQRRSS